MTNISSMSPQAQEVLIEVYVGQNINKSGILQSQIKEKEEIPALISEGLIKENHWYLDQFLTTNKGSEIGKTLVKTRIEKNENSLQTMLQEIPKKVLGFFMKRHVSKRLVFSTRKLVPTKSLQFIFIHSWEDYLLANARIWILWDKFLTSLESVGLCVKTCNYVSTRGGELRDLRYVISPEIQEFLVDRYAVSDFTPSQESALELYPFLMSSIRALDVDDIDIARQQYYELLKDHSTTEDQLAGIVNDMNSKQITSEYRGLLSENKPFDILDISRFQIYLDKNLIEPAVNILLEREARIKERIPKNITREHVLRAMKEIERNGVPRRRNSRKFILSHEGKSFPPKYVVSLANKYANQVVLDSSKFLGGQETNRFLESLGFKILDKTAGVALPPDVIRIEPEKPFSSLMEIFELMKDLTGNVWLLDKHFDENGFKFLRKLDPTKVTEVKVLMGKAHLSKDFKEIYKAFRDEMCNVRVKVQFRVLSDIDETIIHDRYLISRNLAYNTPPWNIIHKKLGDIKRIKDMEWKRKRLEKYWSRATDVLKMPSRH